ncbi:unnamed protein product [Boreogadus saida]
MNYQQHLANSAAIRTEIQRFESVHPNIYSIYELLERVEEPLLQNQIREHVIAIEDAFVNSQEWTLSRTVPELKVGIVGNLASGKSALVHRYLTGTYVQEESPEGKPSCLSVCLRLFFEVSVCPLPLSVSWFFLYVYLACLSVSHFLSLSRYVFTFYLFGQSVSLCLVSLSLSSPSVRCFSVLFKLLNYPLYLFACFTNLSPSPSPSDQRI